MLAMARILRTGARLLLLDEITEGLAPVIVQALGEVLVKLKERGMTIVLVEQNFRFAAPLADRHFVMEHGRIIEEISAAELPSRRDHLNSLLGCDGTLSARQFHPPLTVSTTTNRPSWATESIMTFNRKILASSVALATATLMATGAQAQMSDDAVRIGYLADMSGTYRDLAGPVAWRP